MPLTPSAPAPVPTDPWKVLVQRTLRLPPYGPSYSVVPGGGGSSTRSQVTLAAPEEEEAPQVTDVEDAG